MATITTPDGVNIYYEEVGDGEPVVFVHEFAGDVRSWEPQVRYFSRRYRCIAFAARGFTPSDVPADENMYSQAHARDDILAVLDGLGIARAHIVGLSMGGFASLHFGLQYADRATSLVVAGCGYGAGEEVREQFEDEALAAAERMENDGMDAFGKDYALGPTRVQFQNKDPRGWAEFEKQLREHSGLGSANTMRGVQRKRPSLYELEAKMRALKVPTLILNGDEDEPCLDVGLFMKRTITSSSLVLLPQTGHACNLEEPALFNQFVDDFFHQVESGNWRDRDPRSMTSGILSSTND
ncbi:MAG: alpha/beta hydrolase [Magnetovibrio sp.]|nr:alpha/beta hydrolase [Magnetovibrio sp.]|tara:strand:- start:3886 stop:4773 length:888 start_codon:yes stop_codon:yes gene_type:complete